MLGESPRIPSDRHRLPQCRACRHFNIGSNGHKMAVSCGEYLDGELGEIFLDFSKEGTFGKVMMQAFAMSVSLGLQHGVPLPTFINAFETLEMDPDFIRLIFEELNKIYVLKLKWPDLE